MTETKLVNAVGPTWDACIRTIPVAVGERVKAVVFSPSGTLIAAHWGFCVKVFDAMTGVNRVTFDENRFIFSVAFSPDDGFLVSALWRGTINVWNIQTGTMFRAFKGNMRDAAYSVAFSSCGTMIASGHTDWTVRIWNILLGGCICIFQGHSGIVTDVCWLAMWNQVVSASDDSTVRIWDVQKQTCLKIFSQDHDSVTAVACSQGLLLVASTNGTVNIYDSQSGDIIHVIRSNGITQSRFSIDGGKVLVASRNLGDIWDITMNTLTHVSSIEYNGEQAIFSPDGTRVASIYGKFVKIWKTNTGYNHHEASTHVHETIDGVYLSPDEQLVALKSKKGATILDVITGQSLFTLLVADLLSITFSLDSAFLAFLSSPRISSPRRVHTWDHLIEPASTVHTWNEPTSTVHTWNAHTCHHKSFTIDNDMFHIALSPNGSQMASLSPYHMKLWDIKSQGCLAHLNFEKQLQKQVQISFSIDGTSVSILKNSDGTQSWCISRNHTRQNHTQRWQNHTKLPMVFVPTMAEQSNQNESMHYQSYRCDMNGEWILDQDERCILWIPPDERPRIFLCFKHKKKVLVQTESGKVYFVNFS